MYDFEVSGTYLQIPKRAVVLAHKLRFRKVVSYEKTGKRTCNTGIGCTHYDGMMLSLDDGSSCHVDADDQVSRNAIFYGILKRDVLGWCMAEIQDEFDRIAAVYWAASQRSWKDLAETLVPYLIASVEDGGDEETPAKRTRTDD